MPAHSSGNQAEGPSPRFYAGLSVVVVGGLSPLGAATARRLADHDARVVVLDGMTAGGANLALLTGYEQRIDVKLGEPDSAGPLRDVIRYAAVVFQVPPALATGDWKVRPGGEEGLRHAALAVLDAVRETNPACRAVLASSRRVYGSVAKLPATEETPCRPLTPPAIERMGAEATYRAYADVHDVSIAILRLSTIYGVGGDGPDASLADRFLARAEAGEPVTVYAADDAGDDYLHCADAVEALLAAGQTGAARGGTYNVGPGRAWLPREVADAAVAAAGRGRVDARPGTPPFHRADAGAFVADTTLARRVLGLAQPVDLAEGLRRAAQRR